MLTLIENDRQKIIDACRELQVKSLYLIGSAAREKDFTDKSDLDFMYTMITDNEGMPVSGADYFDIQFRLEAITGKKVDLVSERGIRNKYFLESILKDRIKIYEA